MPALTYPIIRAIDGANARTMRRNLSDLAERNLAEKRARNRRVGMARVAAAGRLIPPGAIVPPPVAAGEPLKFKTRERKRVERPATVAAPEPAPAAPVPAAPEYQPVTAKEIPAETRAVCKLHRSRGDLSGKWFCVGYMPEGDDRRVFARLHGASVRYAVAA